MTTISAAEARAQLSRLIDEATATHQRFEITRHGRAAAVLLSADDFDALRETISVLSDPGLLAAHGRARTRSPGGDFLDADQLAHVMVDAGRLSR
ncbi:MAG: type II toxin-antitoxin system Phd/YefM family antitoxin [Actinomycetota bacterium]|nr:type II toxin-antitoxin system Phd/YefM family antitoxin [Actinomycetota bacterium]